MTTKRLAYHRAANAMLRAAGISVSHRCVDMWFLTRQPLAKVIELAKEVQDD